MAERNEHPLSMLSLIPNIGSDCIVRRDRILDYLDCLIRGIGADACTVWKAFLFNLHRNQDDYYTKNVFSLLQNH